MKTVNFTEMKKGTKEEYLLLEGEQVKAEDMDVEQLYETIMKPGLKK